MIPYSAYHLPATEPQIPEPWPANWRRVTKHEIFSMIQNHPTGQEKYLALYCRPEMRFVLYDALELPREVWDPPNWCTGIMVEAQIAVWSAWYLPTDFGIICAVYSSRPPLGVIQYVGHGNPMFDVLGEIDLRQEEP